jgi:hypothetical protein
VQEVPLSEEVFGAETGKVSMFREPENPLPKAPLIHIWVPRGYGRIHDLR